MARKTLHGTGIGHRTACGPAYILAPPVVIPADEPPAADVTEAAERIRATLLRVADRLRDRAAVNDGPLRDVLEATAQIATDPALFAEISSRLDNGKGPATAVRDGVETFAERLRAAGGLLAERVTDLYSVRDRTVCILLEGSDNSPSLEEPSIVIAHDLSPADTSDLDPALVLGLVTETGSSTSHTAIVAGQLGLPCVVGVRGAASLQAGTTLAVDSTRGTVTVAPTPAEIDNLQARGSALEEIDADRSSGATSDGRSLPVRSNIGNLADARRAAEARAEGVGLFRTELLYLDRQAPPSIAEQAEEYERIVRAAPPGKIVIRTLDAGSDKPLAFAPHQAEENPALGVRGFRLVRTSAELLTDQLAALAQAEQRSGRELHVMAPMVATPGEAEQFATMAHQAGLDRVGVMIEVPSAAIQCAEILRRVDFVSLGTNDLGQYTMAADRLENDLSDLLDRWQPAVLNLVSMAARSGSETGKPVGVCGSAASDPLLALVLCGLGVTSLSMPPALMGAVRFALRRHSYARCQQMASLAIGAVNATEAREQVLALVDAEVREVLLGVDE